MFKERQWLVPDVGFPAKVGTRCFRQSLPVVLEYLQSVLQWRLLVLPPDLSHQPDQLQHQTGGQQLHPGSIGWSGHRGWSTRLRSRIR